MERRQTENGACGGLHLPACYGMFIKAEYFGSHEIPAWLTDSQMIRRAGSFALPPDSQDTIPTMTDDENVLNQKWREFVRRESYKR